MTTTIDTNDLRAATALTAEQKLEEICACLDTENGDHELSPDDDDVVKNVRRVVFDVWCRRSVDIVMGTVHDSEAAPFEREAAASVKQLRHDLERLNTLVDAACEETRVFFVQARAAHNAVVEARALLVDCAGRTDGREFVLHSDGLRVKVIDFLARLSMPPAPKSARYIDIDGEAMNDLLDECINAATSPCNESSAEVIARVIAEHKAKGGST